jgi:hypothetical protein
VFLDFCAGSAFKLHASFPGSNILAACRQLYTEASGVLYTRNTFRTHERMYLLEEWFTNIGGNGALVRKVVIDLGEARPYYDKNIDITFIMRRIWQQPAPLLSSRLFTETALFPTRHRLSPMRLCPTAY